MIKKNLIIIVGLAILLVVFGLIQGSTKAADPVITTTFQVSANGVIQSGASVPKNIPIYFNFINISGGTGQYQVMCKVYSISASEPDYNACDQTYIIDDRDLSSPHLSYGKYYFKAYIIDSEKNVSETKSFTFSIIPVSPPITITADGGSLGNEGEITSQTISFEIDVEYYGSMKNIRLYIDNKEVIIERSCPKEGCSFVTTPTGELIEILDLTTGTYDLKYLDNGVITNIDTLTVNLNSIGNFGLGEHTMIIYAEDNDQGSSSKTFTWTVVEDVPIHDEDGDRVEDDKDNCPDTPEGTTVDNEGCPVVSGGDTDAVYGLLLNSKRALTQEEINNLVEILEAPAPKK